MSRPRCSVLQRICVLVLLALLPAGCAIIPVPTRSARVGASDALGSCADFFADLDHRAAQAQVLDPGAFRVEGYPYLRVNRFLASFRKEVGNQAAFAAWVDQMQALDHDARKYEIANLPQATGSIPGSANDKNGLYGKLASCGNLLKAADFKDNQPQESLRKKATAPDEYMSLPRVLGLYPLISLFVSHGVSNWQAEARKTFSTEPPGGWQTIRYVPEKSNELPAARSIVTQARRDALGIPDYSPDARQALFQLYAPAWEVRTEAEYDRIGAPVWTSEDELDIDTRQPLTYTLLSFTRFGKEILTQLNYIIWFPSRPKENALDIYGGSLDGLNYRVTLDKNGEPLLYETIHNCGCYYEAYPTPRLKVHEKIDYAEPPLILKAPELTPLKQFMTVAMESRTHYVQHLYPSARRSQVAAEVYSLVDYGELRSLHDAKGGRRSMFSPDSLAPGSERLERFILWPTGVVSPGAMRQWGRHAVAFVGERHFDDPFSLDKMFMGTD
ncbi:MAG: hypothetical protein HY895_14875 [Deltaproteobacteria bacterium]|nr:hypothetical protein [Deltaproteobacteria bacterium]